MDRQVAEALCTNPFNFWSLESWEHTLKEGKHCDDPWVRSICYLSNRTFLLQTQIPQKSTHAILCMYVCTYVCIHACMHLCMYVCIYTSSTAQGGGRSFKNRKPIGRVGCCDSRMAERIHWWTERWLELCFLEWLEWLQRSPHSQLLDVVWCSAVVVAVVVVVMLLMLLMLLKLQCCSCGCSCSRSCSVVEVWLKL